MKLAHLRVTAALIGAAALLLNVNVSEAMTIAAPSALSHVTLARHVGGFHGRPGGWHGRPPGAIYRPPGGRPIYYGGWRRPYYNWAPGGAIAAGVAIGVLSAAAAAAYVSSQPPAPGLCWYYTDASRRNGFWDACQ